MPSEKGLSVIKQCELLGIPRSTYYSEPLPESFENLKLMQLIDHIYLKAPFYGSRKMVIELKKIGEIVNRKRVQRLMRKMNLETMYPKPKTNSREHNSNKYPYLLKKIQIDKSNQVWGTDITYVPIEAGYLYLVVIQDLYSRYILTWKFSDNLESNFCIESIEEALELYGKPEIMNSDQGCQFTSNAYIEILKRNKISISMSGKGRCWDNIFVERLWRSYKHEEVYLRGYMTSKEAFEGTETYFNFYNNERWHASLDYCTPQEIYYGKDKKMLNKNRVRI